MPSASTTKSKSATAARPKAATAAKKAAAKAPAKPKAGTKKAKAPAEATETGHAGAAAEPAPKKPARSKAEKVEAAAPAAPVAAETPVEPKAPPAAEKKVAPEEKSGHPAEPKAAPVAKAKPEAPAKAPAPEPKAVAPEPQPPAAPEAPEAPEAAKILHLKPPITVKDLAEHLNAKSYQIIHDLMGMNVFASLTQALDTEVAKKVCASRGFTLEVEKRGAPQPPPVIEQPPEPPPAPVVDDMVSRPPVITFMGHVDHGKTSLMDAIRKANVVSGEAGGITQHIGAYVIDHGKQKITFLDTPGHAAFSAMRARGANLTDIVVLVVAADDGIMPQTMEAISHAKAAGVKILVALNKMDLPGANPDRVKKQLQEQGLVPEEWGGETIVCEVSATKKTGIEKLLENMVALAEILEIKATAKGSARGRVVEAALESGRGPTATVLIQSGTLRVGDAFLSGDYWGKVKALMDDRGRSVKEATPAMPVKVVGFSGVPQAGESFDVLRNEREARGTSEERLNAKRLGKLERRPGVTLENLFEALEESKNKQLNVVLKADVQGSLEAITTALTGIESEKVTLSIIHGAVGPITESDMNLAAASNAVVIGFAVRTENSAATAAKREGVQIKLFSVIYELIDQVREAMAGLLDPIERETSVGTALCKKVIELSKYHVAGCAVINGRITKSGRARILRNRQPIYDGQIVTLKRFQDEVNEVRNGLECGIRLSHFDDYQAGDLIECYQLEKIPQQL